MKNINKTTLFLLLVFSISYLAAGIFYLAGGNYAGMEGIILGAIYMFFPAISVLIVTKVIYREKIKRKLLISFRINRWFVMAWLITPLIAYLALGISLLFPGISYSPDMAGFLERFSGMISEEEYVEMQRSIENAPFNPLLLVLFVGLGAGPTVNAVAAFGEELGWRGFLVDQFRNMHFLKASVISGIIWGLWHAPLILMGHNYPNYPITGVAMMTVFCVLLSPLFLYFTLKARSVIVASIMHGTLNATAGISIMMVSGGNDLLVGAMGLSGFIAILFLSLLVFIYDRYISKENLMGGKLQDYNLPETRNSAAVFLHS